MNPMPLPNDSNGILVALASQERKVLELREELQKAEDDLKKLKKQWTHHDEVVAQQDPCQRCQVINFDDLFSLTLQSPGINGCWVAPLDIRENYPGCGICQLLRGISPRLGTSITGSKKSHHLRAFSASSRERLPPSSIALGICDGSSRNAYGGVRRRRSMARGVIRSVRSTDGSPEFQLAELINEENADFDRMKTWLSDCKSLHSQSCQVHDVIRPSGLKLIDCVTKRIVTANPDDGYFALSYVWGAGKNSSLCRSSHDGEIILPGTVSRVIEDTILVVRSLNGRYLWVDQFCIDQENSQERHIQISNMDKIYEGAIATIVAVSGDGANSGLPGVSCRRLHQPRLKVGNMVLASTLPQVSVLLKASTWATRAWTYQEAVISRRCLFFTDHQVYFSCIAMDCCESLSLPIHKSKVQLERAREKFRTDLFDIDKKSSKANRIGLWEFFDSLQQYKSRALTYDIDSLNAFRGVLSRSKYLTIWGIPIALDQPVNDNKDFAIGFTRGLWWENPGWPYDYERELRVGTLQYPSFRRRVGFPSWSWAGWDGPIMSHGSMRCNYVLDDKFDLKVWAHCKTKNDFISLAEIYQNYAATDFVPDLGEHLSPVLQLEATIYTINIKKDDKYNSSVAYICDCALNSACRGRRGHFTSTYHVRFFEYSRMKETMGKTLFSRSWDAVFLFMPGPYQVALLIIEWNMEMDAADVVGVAYCHSNQIRSWPSRRQKIQLR